MSQSAPQFLFSTTLSSPSPPHCSQSLSPAPAHFSQAMYFPSTPQTCHPLAIHQMPSDIPFVPHYLTAPPKYTPVLTSLICSAIACAFPANLLTCISSLISHSLYTSVLFFCFFVRSSVLSSAQLSSFVPGFLLLPSYLPVSQHFQ